MASSFFSTPQPQQSQPLFQSPQQSFLQNNQFFQQSQPLQFQQPQQQFQPQQQLQQHTQQNHQIFLLTNDKTPASYSSKWADLHPDSQKFLLQIEERILEYRHECQRLDQCSRLCDSSVSNEGFEPVASHVVQELGGIATAMERHKAQLQELTTVAKAMLRNTEVAVRSFMILRPRFIHPTAGSVISATTPSHGGMTSSSTSIMPLFEFYNGLPMKPSPFLQQTVLRFEKCLGECVQCVEELEQLFLSDHDRNSSNRSSSLLQSLPKVMSNLYDFFIHVAAKVEGIHQYIESMKHAYLADHRHRGYSNDPFLEATRRETAKQEAATNRIHRTLHLPSTSQPSTQDVGPIPIPAPPGPTVAVSSASSGSGFSMFNTPVASVASSSSSFFQTPAPSLGTGSAVSPQPSFFSTTPMFANTAASSSTGSSLFSTPFGSGSAAGSGSASSFGTFSKNPRQQKSRTSRR